MDSLNIVDTLSSRQSGKARYSAESVPDFVRRRVDAAYDNMHGLVIGLRMAIDRSDWIEMSSVMGNILTKLLDAPRSGARNSDDDTSNERDTFIAIGGMHQLRRILEPPLCPVDARDIPRANIKARNDLWNEVLVLMREVCFSTPHLADQLFGRSHLVFLFTLLAHQSVFDNAVHLIEEILAVRNETFSLGEVPRFYQLVSSFSTRQLAHFCRVLSLILFEPEDRQIMESAKVLKSFELLQLRRDRLTRAHVNAVELNQGLMIGMPNFLKRMVNLLRILNYGPTVTEYVRHNIAGTSPLSSDVLSYLSGRSGPEEWPHYDRLCEIAAAGPSSTASSAGAGNTAVGAGGSTSSGRSSDDWDLTGSASAWNNATIDNADEEMMNQLLEAFSSNARGNAQNRDPIDSLMNVLQIANRIGLTSNRNNGNDADGLILLLTQMAAASRGGGAGRSARQGRTGSDYSSYTPTDARHELQFQAMILAPHQVEILFVFCTLLSGRRKVQVQDDFAAAGLPRVLSDMCIRMAWDAPPFEGINPMEHIHGPDCECNPESALRIQFLRLVHNYYDRDFVNNPLKLEFFSHSDVRMLENVIASKTWAGPELIDDLPFKITTRFNPGEVTLDKTGLIGSIIKSLLREPHNSTYQFWLSSVIECFLRGSSPSSQIFVARSGILKHLLSVISSRGFCRGAETSLQSNFDLLGELIKYNPTVMVILETMLLSLDGDLDFSTLAAPQDMITLEHDVAESATATLKEPPKCCYSFDSFFKVVMDNIIDSNVFLRSAFMTFEAMTNSAMRGENLYMANMGESITTLANKYEVAKKNGALGFKNPLSPPEGASYLGTSWVHFTSPVVSKEERRWANRSVARHKRKVLKATMTSTARGNSSSISQRSVSSRSDDNSSNTNSSSESFGESRSTNSVSLLASLGNGIRGALTSMKETASSLLSSPGRSKPSSNSPVSDDDEEYKVTSVGTVQDSYSMSSGGCCETKSEGEWIPISTEGNLNSEPHAMKTTPSHWIVSKRMARFAGLLIENKIEIMFNLLTHVTLRSINHENICCLNSAITILIFENRRGAIGSVLDKLREMCKYKSYCVCRKKPSLNKKDRVPASPSSSTGASTASPNASGGADVNPPASPSKPTSSEAAQASIYAQTRDGCIFCKPYQRSKIVMDDSRDERADTELFLNFRELLWYWGEYYLRRGRDRLSLEFSSRLLYSEWKYVVDLLCRDDGSPTSLLARPIALPLSPYKMISPIARYVLAGDRFEDYLVDPECVVDSTPVPAADATGAVEDTSASPLDRYESDSSNNIFTA